VGGRNSEGGTDEVTVEQCEGCRPQNRGINKRLKRNSDGTVKTAGGEGGTVAMSCRKSIHVTQNS
jgi:hypothetical protein